MRKASRLWRDESKREMAARVLAGCRADYFSIEPRELFGREAPLELELGAGRGDFIIERAAMMPERDFLAVELAAPVAQLMAMRAARRNLTNLRVLRMNARPLIHLMLQARSVSACHIYFPDPWPKERHSKNRLVTAALVGGLRRVLVCGAPVFAATDVADYAHVIFRLLEAAGFARTAVPVPGASSTGFARKFIEQGHKIYAAAYAAPAGGHR